MSSSRIGLAMCACLVGGQAAAAPTTEEKLEILTQEVEQLKAERAQSGGSRNSARTPAAPLAAPGAHPHARPATSAENRGEGQTFVGAYGEMHYNNLDSQPELDFHRFILFLGHNFTDRIRFFSELEFESAAAGAEEKGAVELEQGYLEFDLNQSHSAKAGLFVVPVGILNETHEPPTFYGVERNSVETYIIPTTWWEGGAALSGKLGAGLGYDVALTSGLKTPTTGESAYLISSGPQDVSQANANDGALTTRLRWIGIPGVELAATVMYQEDITQANGGVGGASATLVETHAAISRDRFGLRALYARWDIGGDAAVGASPGRDKQLGWYLEPSFKVTQKLGVFARYAEWNNNAGSAAPIDMKKEQTNVGVNYWPHENVVLKFDVEKQQGLNTQGNGFNVGVGYMF